MFNKILIFMLVVCFISPVTVFADRREDERAKCVALEALARTQCKDPIDYSFVGKYKEDVYIFNTFYGSKYKDFFCKVDKSSIKILTRKKTFRRVVDYKIDSDGCAVIDYQSASCPHRGKIRCCLPKTEDDKKKAKEDEFWDRPVPDLLKEDQKEAIKELQNRTSKASESTQEKQSEE